MGTRSTSERERASSQLQSSIALKLLQLRALEPTGWMVIMARMERFVAMLQDEDRRPATWEDAKRVLQLDRKPEREVLCETSRSM